jgi:hypothetical protein
VVVCGDGLVEGVCGGLFLLTDDVTVGGAASGRPLPCFPDFFPIPFDMDFFCLGGGAWSSDSDDSESNTNLFVGLKL